MIRPFVFWTGIYNILLGSAFLSLQLVALFGVKTPESAFWIRFPASLVIFLGVLLVLCSRDLVNRASIVYWEGVLRLAAGITLVYYGISDHLGLMLVVLGVADFAIGLVYLIGLPRMLRRNAMQLLLDQHPHKM